MSELDLFAQQLGDRDDKARVVGGAIRTGLQWNPDEYAQAMRTAAKTGVAPSAVLKDRKSFEEIEKANTIDPAELVNLSPRTAAWLVAKEDHAAIAHDDIGTLSRIESAKDRSIAAEKARVEAENKRKGVGVFGGLGASFTRGVGQLMSMGKDTQDAILNATVGRAFGKTANKVVRALNYALPTGMAMEAGSNLGTPLSEWAGKRERETENLNVRDPLTGQEFFNWGSVNPLSRPGLENVSKLVAAEAPAFLAQIGITALSGGAGGVTLAPKAGKFAGIMAKVVKYATTPAGLMETGRTVQGQYQNGVNDLMRKGMSKEDAEIAVAPGAILAGILSGPTGSAMEGKFMEDLFEKVAKSPGGQTFLRRMASRFTSGATSAAKEGGQEVVQGFAEDLAEWSTYNPDKTFRDVAANAVMNFVGGAAMGGTTGTLIHGTNHAGLVEQTEAALDSKLRRRSPEAFHDAVSSMEDSPVMISADAVKSYFQSQNIDPAQAMEMAGAKNYLEALAAGTDVVIPRAGFLTHLPDHLEGLSDDIRFSPGELTLREAEAYAKQEPKAQKDESEPDPIHQRIFEDTYRQLIDAGQSDLVAETESTKHAAVMANLANAMIGAGLDPETVLAYQPRITRPKPGETGSVVDRALGRMDQPEIYEQRGGGRYATAEEARRARMKRLSQNTQAAHDKFRTDQHNAEEAAFAAFDEDVKALQAGDIQTDERRGFIQFGPDRQVQIGLLEGADLSTFTHELHHLYTHIMGDIASMDGAPEQIMQDYQTLREFAGAEGDAPLTQEQHETLARAGEAYLMEGKAPSEKLREVFQRVKFWMMTVYRHMRNLNVNLTKDVREVFDRLYASQEEIQNAKQDVGDSPLFATAEEAGMTQAEFDVYQKRVTRETEGQKERLQKRSASEAMRERETWWREESAKVREEVTAEVDADLVYSSFSALLDGKLEDGTPIKLNKSALEAQFGKGVGKDLPRGFGRVYAKEGGMDADGAAELLGFPSGEAMVEMFKVMEPRKDRIERLTQDRMKATHGDLMNPVELAEAAQKAVHDSAPEAKMIELRSLRRLQIMGDKLKAMGRKEQKEADRPKIDAAKAETQAVKDQGKAEDFWARGLVSEVPPMATFQKAAEELIQSTPTMDLDPYRYMVAQRKASREAFEAAAKKDYETAAAAKQKELLNHFLYREAIKAKEEVDKAYRYARRFGKDSTRDRLMPATVDMTTGERGRSLIYVDQADNILSRFQFVKESNLAIRDRQSIAAFALEQVAGGEMVPFDPFILSDQPKNYRELTLPELRAVVDALKNIETVARRQSEFQAEGMKVNFDEAVEEMVAVAYANNRAKALPVDPNTQGSIAKAVGFAKKINSELIKMEEMVDRLDRGDINGPFRRFVFNPMCEAQFKEYELNQAITEKLYEAMESMPREQRLSMGDKFTIDGIGTVTRKWILSAAMNTGNESNQTKLLKGMGWAANPEILGRALDKLNRADWEFVQKTWDALETLWPEIEALEVRMTGVAPERVEVKPFRVTLPDGSEVDMRGGYYPMVYDPAKSGAGARQADVEIMKSEGGWNGPVTAQGHTKERVDSFAAPLLMDFEQVLAKHAARVVKDLSHREPATAAAKILMDQRIRTAIQETLGPEYEAQFLPWLNGTVNDTAAMNPALGDLLLKSRANMVIASLAFRASSVFVQATDLGRVMVGQHAVKPRYMLEAMADLARSPMDTVRSIREMSGEMAARAENLDRDTRAMFRRHTGKDGVLFKAQKAGMQGLAGADIITSHTSWLAAYKQNLAEGSTHDEAVKAADRVVRLKLMASAPKDITAVQRAGGAWSFLTTYMGDAVAAYNIASRAAFDVTQGRDIGKHLFAVFVAGMVLPILGDLIKGRGPGDDDDKAVWMAKKAVFGLPSTIPFVRDVAGALENGRDYQFTPLAGALEKGTRAGSTLVKAASTDEDVNWDNFFMNGLDFLGTIGGIPGTGQVITTTRYLKKVKEGDENPENALEFGKNAVFGTTPKKK